MSYDKELTDEESILDEMQDTELAKDWTGMIGTAIICLSMYIPFWMPEMASHIGWVILFGFVIVLAPGLLKWKEVSVNSYIGSETYIGDGDIYEQFAVKNIETVVAAAEPFPFAAYCYEEEDIEKYITDFGGDSEIDPDIIKERITKAVADQAAIIIAKPSIRRALKFWLLHNNRIAKRLRKEKDIEIYNLTEDVEDDINE